MKNYRHQKIMEIIQNNEVETQEELVELLEAEGFSATQATVSRDIKQLNLRKVARSSGKQCYGVYQGNEVRINDKLIRVLRDGFVSMDSAQNILVVRTVSGMAMAVAAAIDALQIPHIVGSIAGDDTVMCAIKSVDDVDSVIESLEQMII